MRNTMTAEVKMIMIPEEAFNEIMNQSKMLLTINRKLENIVSKMAKPLSVTEAKDYLGVSYDHMIRTLKHEIPHTQRGKRITFDLKDLDAWRERNRKS
jgi:excisionase family DNA binding protein